MYVVDGKFNGRSKGWKPSTSTSVYQHGEEIGTTIPLNTRTSKSRNWSRKECQPSTSSAARDNQNLRKSTPDLKDHSPPNILETYEGDPRLYGMDSSSEEEHNSYLIRIVDHRQFKRPQYFQLQSMWNQNFQMKIDLPTFNGKLNL